MEEVATSRRVTLEILAAMALLAWRLAVRPDRAGTDWIGVVALYWILLAVLRNPHARQAASIVVVTHLLCLYLVRQFPHALQALAGAL
jgi:hypothetical protein